MSGEAQSGGPSFAKLVAAYAALVALRAPWLVFAPRFFAEEGILYFRFARDHDAWEALTAPHLGYFALVPNAATVLAAKLPLALAPFATLTVAFVAQLVPGALVAYDRELFVTTRQKLLAFAVLLLPLAMRREWLSTVHTQFWLALSVCLTLVVAPRSRRAALAYAALTVVAALTGAVSDALAPVFLVLGVARRDRRLFVTGLVLGAGALLQASLLAGERSMDWDVRQLFAIALGKLVVVPLTGRLGADATTWLYHGAKHPVFALGSAFVALTAFTLAARAVGAKARLLLLASTYLAVLGLVAALGAHDDLALPMHGIRYVFVANVAYGLVLVYVVGRSDGLAPRVALACMLVTGAVGALSAGSVASAGLDYRADARAHAHDHGVSPRVHDRTCRMAPDARAARRGFAVELVPGAPFGAQRLRITPGALDRIAELSVYVLHMQSRPTFTVRSLRGDRFFPARGHFIGGPRITEPGLCLTGDEVSRAHAFARFRGARFEVDLPLAPFRSLSSDDGFVVGYGRDLPDALAKGTFVDVAVAALPQ
jgi:hypothetical protein